MLANKPEPSNGQTPKQSPHALNLHWSFGFNVNLNSPVHHLSVGDRGAIFYVAGHTGVIYDYENHEQRLLSGHVNAITATCTSHDRKWLVTADTGDSDAMLIVWDSRTVTPLRTYFDPHDGEGVSAVDMSEDCKYLATLSASVPQKLCIWEWANPDREEPLHTVLISESDLQTCVKFNPQDECELIINGNQSVYFVVWDDKSIERHVPLFDPSDFKHTPSGFTTSCFIPQQALVDVTAPTADEKQQPQRNPKTLSEADLRHLATFQGQAFTATKDGDILVWLDRSFDNLSVKLPRGCKAAAKFIRVHQSSIRACTVLNGQYIVTAGEDGFIRVCDTRFRIVGWFERLHVGPILSISFRGDVNLSESLKKDKDGQFATAEFVISTKHARIHLIPEGSIYNLTSTKLILDAQSNQIDAMSVHPSQPLIAIGGKSRNIQIWDYNDRLVVTQRKFEQENMKVTALAFSPDGQFLAIGFANGIIKLALTSTLADFLITSKLKSPKPVQDHSATFTISSVSITRLVFSTSGDYLASSDSSFKVSLYRLNTSSAATGGLQDGHGECDYIGSSRSHYKTIIGLLFSSTDSLVSIGQDQQLVEYDLKKSTMMTGLHVKVSKRVEQTAAPTACCWHPRVGNDSFLVCANSELKFKLLNASTFNTRQTTLGPLFPGMEGPEGALKTVKMVTTSPSDSYNGKILTYSMREKIVGVILLPLDGNPYRVMALVAHPGEITDIGVSFDGRFVFTAGKNDCCVHVWSLNPTALEAQVALGGEGYAPFIEMLPGGDRGEFFQELEDYFYFAQIQTQGEDTTSSRSIGFKVNVEQVPKIMQALGYYPTEQEVENLLTEIRYSRIFETGELVEHVTMEEVIKLYVNHRPVYDIIDEDIVGAVSKLIGSGVPLRPDSAFHIKDLTSAFQGHGEVMTENDVEFALKQLAVHHPIYQGKLPETMTIEEFFKGLLGFDVYDDNQNEDNDVADSMQEVSIEEQANQDIKNYSNISKKHTDRSSISAKPAQNVVPEPLQ